jgi:cell division protein FtsI (penicillin-binding protein 3)
MIRSPSLRTAAGRGVPFSPSPVLAVKLPAWRSKLVMFILFVAFATLAGRAFWLQALTTDFLQKKGASRYARTLELPATRGKILDRNGEVMASSLPVKAIWVEPDDFDASPEKLRALAQLLELSPADLKKKVSSASGFVYLKRQVELDVVDKIVALEIPGIHTREEYKRSYPAGAVSAHLLGFTNVEDIGQEGIELAQQSSLAGITGSRRVIKDGRGRVVEDNGYIREPQDGRELTLSIDSKIQYIAFSHLRDAVEMHKAKAGAIVVLDVKTGEVLALAGSSATFAGSRATPEELQERLDQFDIHPTGPLWGEGSLVSTGNVAAMETAIASRYPQFTAGLIQHGLRQERRPLRVQVADLAATVQDGVMTLDFRLTRGAYATAVLRELVQMEDA